MKIGNKVERIAKDYTGGRKGSVIELDPSKPLARVAWTEERDGSPMKLRTWVRFQDLKDLGPATSLVAMNQDEHFATSEKPLVIEISEGATWEAVHEEQGQGYTVDYDGGRIYLVGDLAKKKLTKTQAQEIADLLNGYQLIPAAC